MYEKEYQQIIKQWKEDNKELIESGKCRKTFLECLPRWEDGQYKGKINWKNSSYYKIFFIYKDIEGYIKIIEYPETNKIKINYNDKNLVINTDKLIKCELGNIIGKVTSEFKIEINTIFNDNKRNLTIIDRKIKRKINTNGRTQNWKYYKYKCNVCGWNEGWVEENALIRKNGCLCCANKVVVEGINDIPTTAPWMVKFFQRGYDEAKLYTCYSHNIIQAICHDCGTVKNKKMVIYSIYMNHSIGCTCGDGISYSEKIIFNILNQLNMIFQTQLNKTTSNWCKNYKYDFAFELNNEQYICEINGRQHYEDAWDKLEKTQLNDKNKKELALANGIKEENYIIIDCRESTLEWIKEHVLESRLNELFDLSSIDWLQAEEFTCNNLVKLACEYKQNNPELTTTDISKLINISRTAITSYLKKGSKLGWCKYNAKEEQIKIGMLNGKNSGKQVEIFKNNISLGEFESATDLERQSENLFGTKLFQANISAVCSGTKSQYKGFVFKHTSNIIAVI